MTWSFAARGHARRSGWELALGATAGLTLFAAPLEGYVHQVNANAGKLAPALFLVTWLAHRFWFRRPLGALHPLVACMTGLLVAVLACAAVNLPDADTLSGAARWIPFPIVTIALVDVLANELPVWLALWALLGGAVVCAGGALFSFVVLGDPRATGPLEDPNDLAYVLAAAVPIVLVRLGTARSRRAALGLAAALALLLAGAGATVSRGGAIAIGLVVLWVVARRIVPLQLFAWGLGLLALLGTGVALIAQDQIQTALNQKSYIAASNVETRNLRWQSALRIVAHDPLFGVGPGAARLHYVEFSHRAEIAETTPVTHEMYLEVAAELGLPGFALFVGAIATGAVGTELTVRRRRRAGARRDDPLLLAAYALQGSLIAVCAASLFLSEEYYMPLWAALAAAAALELRTRPSRATMPGRARAVVA